MSYAEERKAIENRFNSNWSTTSIAWDNIDFTPTSGTAFVALTIHDGDTLQVSLGDTSLHRATGLIIIDIFTGLNIGTSTARGYADTISAIFRNWSSTTATGIQCRSAHKTRIGEEGGWFRYNVTIPYYRDETFTIT